MLVLAWVTDDHVLKAVDKSPGACADMKWLLKRFGTKLFAREARNLIASNADPAEHTSTGVLYRALYIIMGPIYFASSGRLYRARPDQLLSVMVRNANFDDPKKIITAFLDRFAECNPLWYNLIKDNLEQCHDLSSQMAVVCIAQAMIEAQDPMVMVKSQWVDEILKKASENMSGK